MRSLSKLLVVSLLALGGCFVKAGTAPVETGGPPPPEGHRQEGARLVGTIVDARTHQPIAQAAVDISLESNHVKQASGSSDASGHYETPPVAPGMYKVGVRRNGYRAMVKDADLRPGSTELNIELDPE